MYIIGYIIVAIISSFLTFFIQKKIKRAKTKKEEEIAKKIIEEAKKEAQRYKEDVELELKRQKNIQMRELDEEIQKRKKDIEKKESELQELEVNLGRKANLIAKKEIELHQKEIYLEEAKKITNAKKEKLDELIEEENRNLAKIANMSQEEAKQQLLHNLEIKARDEAREFIKKELEKAKAYVEREAKNIISTAIERVAIHHTIETTTCTVNLPSDEMKGRLIGREGRNIRTFENNTGVDLIVDDTPGCVFISSLDPIKREIAKISLERLLSDGRIHSTRIEEVVAQVNKEFPDIIKKIGEDAALELKVFGLHPELIRLLGKLKFRTSYGQNILEHSKEVANLAYLMAQELELNAEIAKRAGLLHDIGKAVSQEYEGTHQKIGANLAKMYGEDELVVNAIEAHHGEIEFPSPIAVLIEASDAISGARLGARRETFEAYVERIEKLESIVSSFDGVEKVYAIQAGREARVIVDPEKVKDEFLSVLANEIAHKIEEEMKFPGEIKVSVIREKRASAIAR